MKNIVISAIIAIILTASAAGAPDIALATAEAIIIKSFPVETLCANGFVKLAGIGDKHNPERGVVTLDTLTGAAAKGDIRKVRELVARGIIEDTAEVLGEALLIAVSAKNIELARALIECGADVNTRGTMGITPLICSTSSYELDITKMLMEKGAAVNGRNAFGMTALMCAAGKNDYDTVKYLIEKGANPDIQADDNGINAVMVATGKGYCKIVELLAKSGANVNARAYNGRTAMMLAEQYKFTDIMKVLKDAGAKE